MFGCDVEWNGQAPADPAPAALPAQLLLLGMRRRLLPKGTKLLLQMSGRLLLFPLEQLLRMRQYPMVEAAPMIIPRARTGR